MFLLLIIILFAMIRNYWVYSTRMKWLKYINTVADLEKYETAASYNRMFWSFWKWSKDMNTWIKK